MNRTTEIVALFSWTKMTLTLTGRTGNHFSTVFRNLALGYCCKSKLVSAHDKRWRGGVVMSNDGSHNTRELSLSCCPCYLFPRPPSGRLSPSGQVFFSSRSTCRRKSVRMSSIFVVVEFTRARMSYLDGDVSCLPLQCSGKRTETHPLVRGWPCCPPHFPARKPFATYT